MRSGKTLSGFRATLLCLRRLRSPAWATWVLSVRHTSDSWTFWQELNPTFQTCCYGQILPRHSLRFIAVRVYFQAACWKRRFHIKETAVSPDEVLSALRRYLKNTGDTERAAALKMGVNRHTLCRWLSDEQSPKKGKMALAAFFLRQAGYL